LLSGARPGEARLVRPLDIKKGPDVWLYRSRSHKGEHLERSRTIVLGPRAQAVLTPWLDRDPDSHCFRPAEAVEERRKRSPELIAKRRARRSKKRTRPGPGEFYTRSSYLVAIQRACVRAGVEPWFPNQLRHAQATQFRELYGLEAAQCVLGHSHADVTQIYAERDLGKAVEIARQVG
jgi:integrase